MYTYNNISFILLLLLSFILTTIHFQSIFQPFFVSSSMRNLSSRPALRPSAHIQTRKRKRTEGDRARDREKKLVSAVLAECSVHSFVSACADTVRLGSTRVAIKFMYQFSVTILTFSLLYHALASAQRGSHIYACMHVSSLPSLSIGAIILSLFYSISIPFYRARHSPMRRRFGLVAASHTQQRYELVVPHSAMLLGHIYLCIYINGYIAF